MCRNLFRSFINFVSHKRSYCLSSHEAVTSAISGQRGQGETNRSQTDAASTSAAAESTSVSGKAVAAPIISNSAITTSPRKTSANRSNKNGTNLANRVQRQVQNVQIKEPTTQRTLLHYQTLPAAIKRLNAKTKFVNGMQVLVEDTKSSSLPSSAESNVTSSLDDNRVVMVLPEVPEPRETGHKMRLRQKPTDFSDGVRNIERHEVDLYDRVVKAFPKPMFDLKSFKCCAKKCGRGFDSLPVLAYHLCYAHSLDWERASTESPTCLLCGARIARSSIAFRIHLKTRHKDLSCAHDKMMTTASPSKRFQEGEGEEEEHSVSPKLSGDVDMCADLEANAGSGSTVNSPLRSFCDFAQRGHSHFLLSASMSPKAAVFQCSDCGRMFLRDTDAMVHKGECGGDWIKRTRPRKPPTTTHGNIGALASIQEEPEPKNIQLENEDDERPVDADVAAPEGLEEKPQTAEQNEDNLVQEGEEGCSSRLSGCSSLVSTKLSLAEVEHEEDNIEAENSDVEFQFETCCNIEDGLNQADKDLDSATGKEEEPDARDELKTPPKAVSVVETSSDSTAGVDTLEQSTAPTVKSQRAAAKRKRGRKAKKQAVDDQSKGTIHVSTAKRKRGDAKHLRRSHKRTRSDKPQPSPPVVTAKENEPKPLFRVTENGLFFEPANVSEPKIMQNNQSTLEAPPLPKSSSGEKVNLMTIPKAPALASCLKRRPNILSRSPVKPTPANTNPTPRLPLGGNVCFKYQQLPSTVCPSVTVGTLPFILPKSMYPASSVPGHSAPVMVQDGQMSGLVMLPHSTVTVGVIKPLSTYVPPATTNPKPAVLLCSNVRPLSSTVLKAAKMEPIDLLSGKTPCMPPNGSQDRPKSESPELEILMEKLTSASAKSVSLAPLNNSSRMRPRMYKRLVRKAKRISAVNPGSVSRDLRLDLIKRHVQSQWYQCGICQTFYDSRSVADKHAMQHGAEAFSSVMKSVPNRAGLKSKYALKTSKCDNLVKTIVTDVAGYCECPVCGNLFADFASLQAHKCSPTSSTLAPVAFGDDSNDAPSSAFDCSISTGSSHSSTSAGSTTTNSSSQSTLPAPCPAEDEDLEFTGFSLTDADVAATRLKLAESMLQVTQ